MTLSTVRIAALVLTALGLASVAYKHLALSLPLTSDETVRIWTVEARLQFAARSGPVKATLRIPGKTPGFDLLDESFGSYGYGVTTRRDGDDRVSVWAKRRPKGEQTLYYSAVVYASPEETKSGAPPFPTPPDHPEPFRSAARTLLEDVREESADVLTFSVELLKRLGDPTPDDAVKVLIADAVRGGDPARIAVDVLAGARIPARVVTGVFLSERQRDAEVVRWLQVHNGSAWQMLDPRTGDLGRPDDYFVWSHTGDPLFEVDGGRRPRLEISVIRNVTSARQFASERAEHRDQPIRPISLMGLPIRTQAVYQILLMLPLGALVVAVVRTLIGLNTTGTFMPVLIALAFRETRLLWGIALFLLIVGIGLVVRSLLARLNLLLVPRLGTVLTIVILLLSLLSVMSRALGIEEGISVALFPVVILVITIERLSIVWDELGGRDAIKEGAASLGVAIIAFFVMTSQALQHFVFVFPEILLLVVAAFLLLGRYTGYRLLEIPRFRSFFENGKP